MIDISVQNVKKAFQEGNDILSGLTFDVNEGEHIGLLGKNGAGKTTLFRLLSGEIESDEGEIVIPPMKRLGLISQIPVYPEGFTTDDVLRDAFRRLDAIRAEMDELEKAMSSGGGEEVLARYDKLAFEYEHSGGYNTEYELNRVANGLEIPQSQREQPFSLLSGGEKTRANLARLILESTDILLLDEPTNHLDMRATEWLEDYISKYKGTVLVISHDRYFLDRTVTRIVELAAGKAEFFSGNYSFYVQEKERRYQETLKRYEREQTEAKRLQEAADRLYQWGTGNKNLMKKSFAIQTRIERLVKTEKPTKDKSISARISEREFQADEALVMRGVAKSYGEKTLFSDLELTIKGGERIALIGDNGAGKTTLIRLIMGEEEQDAGAIRLGPAVKPAYLPQLVQFDNPRLTLLDTVLLETKCSVQTARNRLGAYHFPGEDVFKQVGTLSGGEKSRLRLCILMSGEINFLILDEPTNHLDIPSREWIESAVSDYGETLLFISHDRYFIEKFATRVWELDRGALTDYNCGFNEYRAIKASVTAEPAKKQGQAERKKPARKPADRQKELRKLEREIEAIEAELEDISRQRDEFASDYEKLMELDTREADAHARLDGKYAEWESLAGD